MGHQDVHQSADIQSVCANFNDIHERVARFWGRVEVTSGDGEPCVLISKAELESMERALEIMCELPGNESICKELTKIAALCRNSDDNHQLAETATIYPSSFDEHGSLGV